MKYRYTVELNGGAKQKCMTYQLSYGSTSEINLVFDGKRLSIIFLLGKLYDLYDVKNHLYKVIRESIRRGIILFYLETGKTMKLKSAYISVYDEKESIKNEDIYELLEFEYYFDGSIEVAKNIKNKLFYEMLLSGNKEEFDSKVAPLSAYISSRFRKNTEDRFRDLWMAFNGMYSMIYDREDDNERSMMMFFLKSFHLGNYVLTKDERNRTKGKIIKLFDKITLESFVIDIFDHESNVYEIFSEFINKNYKNTDVTPAGFAIAGVGYLIRCDIFHAHRPIPLIGFVEDTYIRAVQCVTRLLEVIVEEKMMECYRMRGQE